MHIKQIIIEGFKSYKEKTIVEPFDKRHNVVVGRNGSGKSNFFYAIQFVLSDEFNHLGPDARQQLLHEGAGDHSKSAYVEIIFDNTDNRVPIDKQEIFLRRVIGAKKDQYLLNRKVVSRVEVVNLLESAGFSMSNPYYIVKQGKINQMATAPDSYRYKLLRELAGTRVFDERKEASMNTLRDTKAQLQKVTELLRTLDERMKRLKVEKEELDEFQKWDKVRRTLEYVIHETELKNARKALDNLDKERKSFGGTEYHSNVDVQKAQEQIKVIRKSLKDAKKEASTAKDDRSLLIQEQQSLLQEKAKLDLTITDLIDEVQDDSKSKELFEHELERLTATIQAKESELNQMLPEYNAVKRKEEECAHELALKEQKRKKLYAKQGRRIQFSSRVERDQWIRSELESLGKQIEDKIAHQNKLTEDLEADGAEQSKLEGEIAEQTAEEEKTRRQIEEQNKGYYALKKIRDNHQAARNNLWQEETQITRKLSTRKEELAKVDQDLRSMAGMPILNGRVSVRKVLEGFVERGGPNADIAKAYYGTVIENFGCHRKMHSAVEVTAGKRLFHHIVESGRIATQILNEMNRLKLPGELTFLPLDRIKFKNFDYFDDPDSFPLISKLTYEERYDKALRHIFGKTLICRDFQRATELARSTKFDCVTPEGDKASSNGLLSGGYIDKDRSVLETHKRRTEHIDAIKILEDKLGVLRNDLQTTECSINVAVLEMQQTETKQGKSKLIFDNVQADIRLMNNELTRIKGFQSQKEHSLAQCKMELQAMNCTKESLESEFNEKLTSQLSSQDQRDVNQLNDDIRRLKQVKKEAFGARIALEVIKTKLETTLTNNLLRRRDELLQSLREISIEDRKRKLQNHRTNVLEVEKRIAKVMNDLEAVDKSIQDAVKAQKSLQKDLDRWSQKEKEEQEKFEENSKKSMKWAAKENSLRQKIDECTEKIHGLGALPQVDPSYTKMSLQNLLKELVKANTHLNQYANVNKKAHGQLLSFHEQKETLSKRKDELDLADMKICELMQTLETRKVEANQITFKQVAGNFATIFKKLVPQGCGHLVLKTTVNDNSDSEEDMMASSNDIVGIGIRVSFLSGTEADTKEMHQLSGGQKSLVALTLIFSIQKCNPAPFYLFDEVDQALDPPHRKAVGDVIHELSENAQFITTTFRPELMERAHKFYGVRYRNKLSHVDCVTKEEARDFIDDDQGHD